jgi:hypothetical protein
MKHYGNPLIGLAVRAAPWLWRAATAYTVYEAGQAAYDWATGAEPEPEPAPAPAPAPAPRPAPRPAPAPAPAPAPLPLPLPTGGMGPSTSPSPLVLAAAVAAIGVLLGLAFVPQKKPRKAGVGSRAYTQRKMR